MASSSTVTEALDDMGFGGLWRSCSVGSMEDIQRECFDLTEKLIEVSFRSPDPGVRRRMLILCLSSLSSDQERLTITT